MSNRHLIEFRYLRVVLPLKSCAGEVLSNTDSADSQNGFLLAVAGRNFLSVQMRYDPLQALFSLQFESSLSGAPAVATVREYKSLKKHCVKSLT